MSASSPPSTTLDFNFGKFIVISVAGHFVLCLFLFVRAALFPTDPIDIRSAIRVDVVALPERVKAPPKPPAAKKPTPVATKKPKPKPKPKPTQPKTKKVNLKKAKTKQNAALEKLKALEAIENLKKEVANEQKPEKAQQKPQEFKGNAITSGSSLTGLDRIAFERYFDDMTNHVKQHWDLPAWLANANLKNQVTVKIDERGYVIDRNIKQTSNNEVFDNLALETVDRASPFPEPPPRLKNVLALKGFILRFPE